MQKRVGFFSNLKHGDKSGDALANRTCEPRLPDQVAIARYLRNGQVYAASAGLVRDVLEPSREIIGPLAVLTDGVWFWPTDLVYYLEKYNAPLHAEFIEHVRSRVRPA